MNSILKKVACALLFIGCATGSKAQTTNEVDTIIAIVVDVKPITLMPKEGDNFSALGLYAGGSFNLEYKKFALEVGLGLQQASGSTKQTLYGVKTETDYSWLAFDQNLDFGYVIPISNSNVRIVPFVGAFTEVLLSAKAKSKAMGQTQTIDLTDKDEAGDGKWVAGVHAEGGVKAYLGKRWMVKLKYGKAVLKYNKNLDSQYFSIGGGLIF